MSAREKQSQYSHAVQLPNDGPWASKSLESLIKAPFENQLVQDLSVNATSASQQLRHLQKFRSQVHAKCYKISNELYRILVEWMVSSITPVNFRRALVSTLQSFPSNIFPFEQSEMIARHVLDSILQTESLWANSVLSASELVAWKPETTSATELIAFLVNTEFTECDWTCCQDDTRIQHGIQWSGLIDVSLARNDASQAPDKHLELLREGLWRLLSHSLVPSEHLFSIAIALARTASPSGIDGVISRPGLPALQKATLFQGLAAVFPLPVCLQTIRPRCHALACSATEPDICTVALKAIRSIVSRLPADYPDQDAVKELEDETLDLVLVVWENPQCRKLAYNAKALFSGLITLMKSRREDFIDDLLSRVLGMSLNRKSRYSALEILLPLVGPSQLISKRTTLLSELINGITDQGSSTGPIADLWAKLLRLLLEETQDFDEWLKLWVPSVAAALVSSIEVSRRRRVADFCLPRIGNSLLRNQRGKQAEALAQLLGAVSDQQHSGGMDSKVLSKERESSVDRVLFAELEITSRCSCFKLDNNESSVLHRRIGESLPVERLKDSLAHFCAHIRLVAFKCLHVVAPIYSGSPSWHAIEYERSLWLYSLPFSTKTENKEFRFSLFLSLVNFLDRLSQSEAAFILERNKNEVLSLETFISFSCGFLLGYMLEMVGYPGAPPSKASFMHAILEALIVYSTRDHPVASTSKFLPKSSAIYLRRRHAMEHEAMQVIRMNLLSAEVFCALFSSLHSSWDAVRTSSFKTMQHLVILGRLHSLSLPKEFAELAQRRGIEACAISLASSPRPRESDSGSLILAFLVGSDECQINALGGLLKLFETRLSEMKLALVSLSSEGFEAESSNKLPLVHGIVRALHLALKGISPAHFTSHQNESLNKMFPELVSALFRALRVSLSIVADIADGDHLIGLEDDNMEISARAINPGAIGANGIFQSIERLNETEVNRRNASQRIIVGSWLLTKEACEALSRVLSFDGYGGTDEVYDEAGMLLISTMTSLKHAGAAFAGSKALHVISSTCLKDGRSLIRCLPLKWVARLFTDVQEPDNIRDSTLRRSQGYALAFVALCQSIISVGGTIDSQMMKLLRFALPSDGICASYTQNQGLFLLSVAGESTSLDLIEDAEYNTRTRVHCLNILRLIVQDAALSKATKPFVGVALMAATLGYMDSEWSIRNSSTLLFSSAMLRAVDPDKNGSNSDPTGKSAISAHELFRTYPTLSEFLFEQLNNYSKQQNSEDSIVSTGSLPPFLPILVLFSRIHPVATSGQESSDATTRFFPVLIQFTEHRIFPVRKAAARAVRNLLSIGVESTYSVKRLVGSCLDAILSHTSVAVPQKYMNWNRLHGSLLLLKEIVSFPGFADELTGDKIADGLLLLSDCNVRAIPPPCIAVGLDVLQMLPQGALTPHIIASGVVIASASFGHRKWSGVEALGATVGRATTASICDDLLKLLTDAPFDRDRLANAIPQLFTMISSSNTDVRITAVKTFKRRIHKILQVLSDPRHRDVFRELTCGLQKVLTREVECESRQHRPTIRRISRCFLESVDHVSSQEQFLISEDIGWGMLRFCFFEERALPDYCIPPIVGNGLELLALSQSPKGSSAFWDLLSRLSSGSTHWRLRHSAATALQQCHIRTTIFSIPIFCPVAFNNLALLLQDDDIDVRLAAVQTVSDLNPRATRRQIRNKVPENIWHVILKTIADLDAKNNVLCSLLTTTLSIIDEARTALSGFLAEYTSSLQENGTIPQPVFEEEQVSEYREQAIHGELLFFLIKSCGSWTSGTLDLAKQVTTQSFGLLEHVLRCLEAGHVAAIDMTRRKNTFPALYTSLIVCSALSTPKVYTTFSDSLQPIQALSSKILSMNLTIHPRISAVLQVLASPEDSTVPTFLLGWPELAS